MKKKISLVLVFVLMLTMMAPLKVEAAVYASSFTPRLSVPTASDSWMVKYNVSNNCTRYAYARISEILNRDATSLLGARPGADGFPSLLQNAGYTASNTPKPGSVMCTSGHVAIVESVNTSSGYLIVSEGHSWTDMSGNLNLYNGICVVNGSSVLGYSTLTQGSRHGTWFDLRKIYYPNVSATYYPLVSSSGTNTPPPSCSCSTSYAGNYVCIADGGNVNIRSEHNTNCSILGKVPPGALVWISKANGIGDGYWGHVTYNGVSGYVSMKYFTPEVVSYTVSYNANGGSGAPGASTHNKGSTHTVPSTIPTRFGYTFDGWSTSSTATSASYRPGSKITVNGNKTLYAVWSQTTISENIGRGSGTADIFAPGCCKFCVFTPSTSRTLVAESTGSVDSKITVYDSSGSVLASDDDSGTDNNFRLEYRFQQGTKYYIKISAYSNGTGDIPFSIKRKYTISYNANGGSGAPAAQYKLYGDTITLSSTVPTRSGYTFLGWDNASSATTAQYNPGSSYSADASVTLYAVWRQNAPTTYTVSYSANGGSGAPSSQTHTSGAAHTVTSTIPERFGYTFVGWGTTSSATSGYLPGQTFSVTSNRTLYAIWQTAVSFSSTHQTGGYSANIIAPEHCRYYTITPSYTRKYRIESTGSIDSKVTIYNASGTELTSDDDSGNENNFSLNYTFQSGQKYYIKIHAYGENTGSIPFTMKAIWNITYNANGGSGAPSSQEKLYGQNVYLSST
ncbi:MAG: InlB B-repeat-containing protein, partial [Clostridia bacterium]|nr:InlB B-repeat-containing protein [Clostridia bacterium]